MNTSVKNTRSLYWDNIKGFLMLLVVFAIYPLQFSGGFHCYRFDSRLHLYVPYARIRLCIGLFRQK